MRIKSLFLAILLIFGMLLSFTSCGTADGGPREIPEEDILYIAIEDYGIVTVGLFAKKAPITVANFKKLASEGFYDGLTFHRVIESFMIQGGCPKGDGTGDAGEDIKGEFKSNGVKTRLKHVEGTISMARSGHPWEAYLEQGYVDYYGQRVPLSREDFADYFNSASSQFFIVTETSENNALSLDGNYAAFGRVLEGMDIVKAIAAVDTNESDKPLKTVTIATITADRAAAEAALSR